jgi:hypothetical protein
LRRVVEDVGDRGHRGQRGAQLVGHVGHEAPRLGLHPAQIADVPFQRFRGVVERARDVGQLVRATDPGAGSQIPLAQPVGRPAQLANRAEHTAAGQQGQQHGEDQRHRAGEPCPGGEPADALLLGLQAAQGVDLQLRRQRGPTALDESHLGADDQHGSSVHRYPLPHNASLAYCVPQFRWQHVRVRAAYRPAVPVDGDRGVVTVGQPNGDLLEPGLAGRHAAQREQGLDPLRHRLHRGVLGVLQDDAARLDVVDARDEYGGAHPEQREGHQQAGAQAPGAAQQPGCRGHSGPNR